MESASNLNMPRIPALAALLLLLTCLASAQADRAVMVREAVLYLNPDTNSNKIGRATRGDRKSVV